MVTYKHSTVNRRKKRGDRKKLSSEHGCKENSDSDVLMMQEKAENSTSEVRRDTGTHTRKKSKERPVHSFRLGVGTRTHKTARLTGLERAEVKKIAHGGRKRGRLALGQGGEGEAF